MTNREFQSFASKKHFQLPYCRLTQFSQLTADIRKLFSLQATSCCPASPCKRSQIRSADAWPLVLQARTGGSDTEPSSGHVAVAEQRRNSAPELAEQWERPEEGQLPVSLPKQVQRLTQTHVQPQRLQTEPHPAQGDFNLTAFYCYHVPTPIPCLDSWASQPTCRACVHTCRAVC